MLKPTYNSWEEVPEEVVRELLLQKAMELDHDELGEWLAQQLGLKLEQIPPGETNRW